MKIALVDDDEIFVYLISKIIEHTDSKASTSVYNNGSEILEYIKQNSNDISNIPDLIFLDISMPVMDGWQFLTEYEQLPSIVKDHIKIYLTSSSISPYDYQKSKENNLICEFIIKPISRDKISQILEKNSITVVLKST